mmetsp:Transcript_123468/g.348931  ORF Transcript_123468/g.348931 Transcript_123468/m.348931 type:complete len:254 (-) Transcript_123468:169-930(-)
MFVIKIVTVIFSFSWSCAKATVTSGIIPCAASASDSESLSSSAMFCPIVSGLASSTCSHTHCRSRSFPNGNRRNLRGWFCFIAASTVSRTLTSRVTRTLCPIETALEWTPLSPFSSSFCFRQLILLTTESTIAAVFASRNCSFFKPVKRIRKFEDVSVASAALRGQRMNRTSNPICLVWFKIAFRMPSYTFSMTFTPPYVATIEAMFPFTASTKVWIQPAYLSPSLAITCGCMLFSITCWRTSVVILTTTSRP